MGGISAILSGVALIGFLMFLAGIGFVVVSASQGRPVRSGVMLSITGLVLGLLFSVVSQGILIVEPTQRAVVFQTLSGELETPRGPGTSIILPILQQATIYDITLREYTVAGATEEGNRRGDDAVRVRTVDGQEVLIDATVIYRINPDGDNVNTVHRLWQNRFEDDFVRPVMRGLVRDVISGYRAEAVYSTSRGDIQRLISEELSARLATDGLQVTDFLIRNVTFSNQDFINSIEQVQIAERRAQEAQFRVQQEQQEAARVRVAAEGERDAAITRAEGEAEAIRIRAAAEAEALSLVSAEIANNPNLIQYEYVQKLAPNVGLILLPSNSPFLFDFNSLNNMAEQNGVTLPQAPIPATPTPAAP